MINKLSSILSILDYKMLITTGRKCIFLSYKNKVKLYACTLHKAPSAVYNHRKNIILRSNERP